MEDELSLMPSRVDLPRGRSALPESEVDASRRGRIQQAVIEEVAAGGYHGATVSRIIKRARVSRTTFYEAYADKEEAFAAAHLAASDRVLDLVWGSVDPAAEGPVEHKVRSAVESYVRGIEASPVFSLCFLVEIRGAGDRLLAQRDAMVDRHVEMLARLFGAVAAENPAARIPTRDELRGVIGAFDELAGREIRARAGTGRLDLHRVVEPFVQVVLALMRPA